MPLTPRLRERLKKHMADHRFNPWSSPWVFHHRIRQRRAKAGERITTLARGFKSAAERAECPEGFTQHDLRHRRVTSWLDQGASVVIVAQAMGHQDVKTTMGYDKQRRERLRSLVEEPKEEPRVTGT